MHTIVTKRIQQGKYSDFVVAVIQNFGENSEKPRFSKEPKHSVLDTHHTASADRPRGRGPRDIAGCRRHCWNHRATCHMYTVECSNRSFTANSEGLIHPIYILVLDNLAYLQCIQK